MSSGTLTSRARPSQNQFLGDITQVFRRHKISLGHRADLDHLAADLQTNEAFRSDLFSLCTAISHMSESDLTPEALLDLVARALTNARGGSASPDIPEEARNTFLSTYTSWSNRVSGIGMIPGDEEPPQSGSTWQSPANPFSTAATLSGTSPQVNRAFEEPPARPPRALAPDTPIGSLTLGELKNYLEDIEQRVSRLQPFLDAVAKSSPAATAVPASFARQTPDTTPSLVPPERSASVPAVEPEPVPARDVAFSQTANPTRPEPDLTPRAATPPPEAPPAPVARPTVLSAESPEPRPVAEPALAARPGSPRRPKAARRPLPSEPSNLVSSASPAQTSVPAAAVPLVPAVAVPSTALKETAAPNSGAITPSSVAVPAPQSQLPAVVRPATTAPLRGKVPNFYESRTARTAIPAAAAILVVVTAGVVGYRHVAGNASAATIPAATTAANSTATSEPSASPPAPQPRSNPAQRTHAPDASAKTVVPASSNPTPATRAVPTATIASTSHLAATLKPILQASAPLAPATSSPAMKQPLPSIPDTRQGPAVVPAIQQTPAQPRQVIEPYNQRALTQPESTPAPAPTIVAADSHPTAPTATPAPITRRAPDSNLLVSVPSPTMMTYAISTPAPDYPSFRRPMDVSVIVQATIGKDGRVSTAHPVSGPSDLAGAAVNATRRWRFRPYVVDGSPVQVVTDIKFVFKGPH